MTHPQDPGQLLGDIVDALESVAVIFRIEGIGEHDVIPAATASIRLDQPSIDPAATSFLSRARTLGSFRRSKPFFAPCSQTQFGTVISSPVPPAVYTYISAAMFTPRARAVSMSWPASGTSLPQPAHRPFEVENLHLDSGLLADLDGFADRLQQLGAFIAHVACVNAAAPGCHARELHEVVGALKLSGG